MKKEHAFAAVVLIFLIANQDSFAQKTDRKLNGYAKVMDYSYKQPEGFFELDSGTFVKTNICSLKIKNKKEWHLMLNGNFDYSIISKKKDVVVTFMILPGFNSWNYYRTIQLYADTMNYPIIHYAPKQLKKTSDATKASLYVPNCPFLHKTQYPNLKIVILYKKGKGVIQLFYYYTDKAADRIDKCIRKTADMIQFKA